MGRINRRLHQYKYVLIWLTVLTIMCVYAILLYRMIAVAQQESKKDVVTSMFFQLSEFSHLDTSRGELDSSSRYKIHPFFITGRTWSKLSVNRLTLATQTSIEHLHWLVDTLQSWTGPVSVAVFTPDIEYQLTVVYISYLRRCFDNIRDKVTFHFLYPMERPPKFIEGLQIRLANISVNCKGNPKQFLEENLLIYRTKEMMERWRERMLYPQNILRNVAKRTCSTDYVMCADVDMIPTSTHMIDNLEKFLSNENCTKCAYVLPVYEISSSLQKVPHNKSELMRLVQNEEARPFHIEVFERNQNLSDLIKWEKWNVSDTLSVAYPAKKFDFFYEPIYVSEKRVPPYDERFLGYGNTRNTQVYEMFLNGWTFHVLNNAFLIHWGFQNKTVYPQWRRDQIEANRLLFKDYIRDMATHYDKDPVRLLKRYPKNNTEIIVIPKENRSEKSKKQSSETPPKKISS